jgi:hypothetical protein
VVGPLDETADPDPLQIEDETNAAVVKREATTGSVLPFPARIVETQNEPENESRNTGYSIPANDDLFEVSSLKQNLFWRPVKYTKNRGYPMVVAEGCGWKRDSAGWMLRRPKPFQHLGYYRQEMIDKLEKIYGKKKPRKRRKNRTRRST